MDMTLILKLVYKMLLGVKPKIAMIQGVFGERRFRYFFKLLYLSQQLKLEWRILAVTS